MVLLPPVLPLLWLSIVLLVFLFLFVVVAVSNIKQHNYSCGIPHCMHGNDRKRGVNINMGSVNIAIISKEIIYVYIYTIYVRK